MTGRTVGLSALLWGVAANMTTISTPRRACHPLQPTTPTVAQWRGTELRPTPEPPARGNPRGKPVVTPDTERETSRGWRVRQHRPLRPRALP